MNTRSKMRMGSSKPKVTRTVSAEAKSQADYQLKARRGREDAEDARAIADMYGEPCDSSEFK